jgi:hypothetical protein
MVSTSLVIGDKEYQLRYTYKQLKEIRENASKKFLGKDVKMDSPLAVLDAIGLEDIQIYLLEKGLEWEGSGFEKINFDKAADLRQDFLEQGEPDDGTKQNVFAELLISALVLNAVGADSKKLMEKARVEKEKREAEALEKIYTAKAASEAGTSPSKMPLGFA